MARILIVDDDPDILDLLGGMLTPEHEVAVTTDPDHALEAIRDGSVDLLVTDIRMPGRNGFMLIKQARAIRPQLGIILISAYYEQTDEIAREIVHQYAPIALRKPVSRSALVAAVSAALP